MYARVVRFPLNPEMVEQGIQALRQQVIPDTGQEPGYHSSQLLIDRQTGEVMVVSAYDTDENARRRDPQAFGRRLAMLEGMLAGRPQPSFYEIID